MRLWIVGLACLGGATARAQNAVYYPNFADVSALTFAGNATGPATVQGKQVLQLVPAQTYQSGAAYLTTPILLGGGGAFTSTFQFRVRGGSSAAWSDGLTFVLAASPAGLGAPGASGGGLGYVGASPLSLAVEYDTYYNAGQDALPNEVAVTTAGSVATAANPPGSAGQPYGVSVCDNAGPSPPGCINDGKLWTTEITYDGTVMNVKVQDGPGAPFQVIANYKIDLRRSLGGATQVYAGFTAATGGGYANFYIYDWRLVY